MSCFQARVLIIWFAAGDRRRQALLHTAHCARCSEILESELVLEKLLRVTAPPDSVPSPDFYQRLRQRIDREVALQASARRIFSNTWESTVLQFQNWVFAGSFAAILVLGFVVYSGRQSQPSMAGRDRISYALISQRGERIVLTRTDPLSQDEVLFALLSEDPDHVRN
jgi:hypothetical protein